MYIPKYFKFKLQELLPKDFYTNNISRVGNLLWQVIDDRLLITLDNLRNRYGRINLNNWYWNGNDQWRGLRNSDSPYWSDTSQHSYGRAADALPQEETVDKIRKDIINDPFHNDFKYITGIELKVSWLHIDIRNWNKKENGLYLFNK